MNIIFNAILLITLSLFISNNTYAQSRKGKTVSSARNVSNKFYVTLNLSAGYAVHSSVNLYSNLGVNSKIACQLSSQNVYLAEEYVTSDPFTRLNWCKLFSLDGKFLGYISSKSILRCKPPVAPELEMVDVKGGTFIMGNNTDPEASPEHQVSVSDFKISKYEITALQWYKLFGEKGIIHYSWDDVQNFIIILNRLTKKNYRLPTEAEWEYAAKGGLSGNGYKYSGSDSISIVAWYDKNSDFLGESKMVKPGSLSPNELGLYDMSGNLWEYCQDYYDYYSEDPQADPVCKNSKSGYRVIRGGGVDAKPEQCTTTYRGKTFQNWVNKTCGFRLVLDQKPQNNGVAKRKK